MKELSDKIEGVLNATSMQRWYYNIYKNAKDPRTLMMDLEFVFSGTIDIDILRKAWNLVLKKYPMLRTGFHETKDHELFQVIYKEAHVEFESASEAGNRDKKRIDLQTPPLFRLYLTPKDSDEFSLRWYFPVLLMDGWNVPILYKDLLYYYSAYYAGKNSGVALASCSMKKYILYQRNRDKSDDERFWKNYFSSAESMTSPQVEDALDVDYQRLDISLSDLEQKIRENAKKIGVSLNCVFQLSYMLALAQLQNKKDVYSRTTVADRPLSIKNIHNLVGLYINEIPIRLSVSNRPFPEMAKELQRDMNQLFSHVSSSLSEISSYVGIQNLMEIDNTITFENMPMEEIDYSSLPFSLTRTNFANHPYGKINVFVWPNKGMNLKLLYDAKTYSLEAMTRFGNRIRESLDVNL